MSDTGKNFKIVNSDGAEVGSVALNQDLFGARVLSDVVHQNVRWQRAKRRAGTHSVLTRSNMKGGAKKPWKQKGTGRARAGSSISPHWVGGAVVHGPTPRSYEFRMPKALRFKALSSVLTDKATANEVVVVDRFDVKGGKTKLGRVLLEKLKVLDGGVTVVISGKTEGVEAEHAFIRAVRNIPGVSLLTTAGVNPYDLLKNRYVLFSKETLEAVQSRTIVAKKKSAADKK